MDDQVFDDFYEHAYGRQVRALTLVTGDADVARDAVDEALARAWEQLKRGRVIDVLEAWVRTVALNVARGRFRRQSTEKRAQSRLLALTVVEADATPILDVRRALAALPRRQREITVLFYFLDLSVDDIAQDLRVAPGTVRATLHRSRRALAALLGDQEVSHDRA
jgi:RNA polymerase sigma-70 factor (ECF subfamily)